MIVPNRPSATAPIPTTSSVEIPPLPLLVVGAVTGAAVVAVWVVLRAGTVGVGVLRPPNGAAASAVAGSASATSNAGTPANARIRRNPGLTRPIYPRPVRRLRRRGTQATSDPHRAARRPGRHGADADAQQRAARGREKAPLDRVLDPRGPRRRALRRGDGTQLVPKGDGGLHASEGADADPPDGRRLAGPRRAARRRPQGGGREAWPGGSLLPRAVRPARDGPARAPARLEHLGSDPRRADRDRADN